MLIDEMYIWSQSGRIGPLQKAISGWINGKCRSRRRHPTRSSIADFFFWDFQFRQGKIFSGYIIRFENEKSLIQLFCSHHLVFFLGATQLAFLSSTWQERNPSIIFERRGCRHPQIVLIPWSSMWTHHLYIHHHHQKNKTVSAWPAHLHPMSLWMHWLCLIRWTSSRKTISPLMWSSSTK